MEVFTLAFLVAIPIKFTAVTKFIRAKQWGDALTQLYVTVVAVVVAFLGANANAMENIDINGASLGSLDAASTVLLGLGIASVGSVVYDFKKARDNNDTAKEPSLV